jgi:hypothetical protein
MGQKIKKKRKLRAHTQHLVFARLAFTSPSKKHDKQLTFIVRVINRLLIYHWDSSVLSSFMSLMYFKEPALESRGTILNGAENLSRYRNLLESR